MSKHRRSGRRGTFFIITTAAVALAGAMASSSELRRSPATNRILQDPGVWVTFNANHEPFQALLTRPDAIEKVIEWSTTGKQPGVVSGRISTEPGYNLPYSWSLVPETVAFVEIEPELPAQCRVPPMEFEMQEHWRNCTHYSPRTVQIFSALDCRSGTCEPLGPPVPSPTPTVTVTPSPRPTVTVTPSPLPTVTVTPRPLPTITFTPSPLPTVTFTPRPLPTFTFPPIPRPTFTPRPSPTPTPTVTPTPTPTPTVTPTPTPTPYDSCAGKVCGDRCTICAPNDPACTETAVEKECTAEGQCEPAPAACEEERKKKPWWSLG